MAFIETINDDKVIEIFVKKCISQSMNLIAFLEQHPVSAVIGGGGMLVLFGKYALSLLPRAGDKIKPFDAPEIKAIRPVKEHLMDMLGIPVVHDRDVP